MAEVNPFGDAETLAHDAAPCVGPGVRLVMPRIARV